MVYLCIFITLCILYIAVDDTVVSGVIVQNGYMEVCITKAPKESTMQQLQEGTVVVCSRLVVACARHTSIT